MTMPSEQELLAVVGQAYRAATEPEVWADALNGVARVVDATVVALVAHRMPSGRGLIQESVGLDPAMTSDYERYYAARNIWVLAGRPRPGVVFTGEELVSDSALLRSEFYNDHLHPYDYRYSIGTTLLHDEALMAFLAVGRPHHAEPFGDPEKRVLSLFVPHLRNAVRLRRFVDALEARASAIGEILDRLEVGVVLLGRGGRAVFANATAREIAQAHDGFTIDASGLRGATSNQTEALGALVAMATDDSKAPGHRVGGRIALARTSGARSYSVLVAPLSPKNVGFEVDGAVAVAFVADPDRALHSPADSLRALYALTPAEARLAIQLAQGRSLHGAADELQITLHTARSQLKAVFAKCGVSRQAELVQLLMAVSGGVKG